MSFGNLIEKLNARDKDERYMAMHDLAADLDRDTIKLDGEMERRVVAIILKHLEDTGTDVKQQAVRTIASLAKKVQETQLEEIADKLATHILNKTDEEKRDIGSIGLKTLVGVLTPATAPAVLRRVTPKLQQGIGMELEVSHYCLEILNDLLKSFGTLMFRDLASIQTGILPMLSSSVSATRKRVATCVASLAICAPEQLFVTLVGSIFTNIEASRNADQIRTYIQTIAGISRSVGHRLGRELKRIIPLFMTYCEDPKYQEDVEMLENCLQAFESFVLRCPKEIGPHLESIISISIQLCKYDPNYADDGDEDEEAMEEDEEQEDEYSDDGDYSGDDDSSWKVRSASIKCLDAVIRTRSEMLFSLYKKAMPTLLARFREREDIVKMDVFTAFKDLLRQNQTHAQVDDPMDEDSGGGSSVARLIDVDKIVKAICKQLREKSIRTKERCLEVLRELIAILDGGLAAYLPVLIPDLEKSVEKGAKASLKIEALLLLSLILEKHKGSDFEFSTYIKKLGPSILQCVGDSNYKISAVALKVCGKITSCRADWQPGDGFVSSMYQATYSRLGSIDQDLEVKESAITTMGLLVAQLADKLKPDQLGACLPVLLERLRNETTRITALKAFATIANSPLQVDLGAVVSDVVLECSTFLRKNDRALKQAALTSLNSIITRYAAQIAHNLYESVARELAGLIAETELHLTHLALQLCETMVRHAPASIPLMQQHILPRATVLLQSSLLQGTALGSAKGLFSTLASANSPTCPFESLLGQLLDIVCSKGGGQVTRQSTQSIAQCVSSLCHAAGPKAREDTIKSFMTQLSAADTAEQVKLLLLHCLGEIGKEEDLSAFSVESVIVTSFKSSSEDTKSAASHALGSVAVGAMSKYLPYILEQIQGQAESRYLLLQSLRQLLTLKAAQGASGAGQMADYVSSVMSMLLAQCAADEEGERSMVAECLGRLAVLFPGVVLPQLRTQVSSDNSFARATSVYALKFTITDHAPMAELAACVTDFLLLLKDPEVIVRRAALTSLNSATHNKPSLIRPLMGSDWLMPTLYGETVYKKEMVRTVNLGPFQHKVDDGAELRKLALACMDTLLDKCPDMLGTPVFLQHVQDRLSDELDDIKQASYQLLSKLAVREPHCVREVLDTISEPLNIVLSKKPKENASPQDIERQNELQRTAMMTVVVLHRMEDSHTCLKFQQMFDGMQGDAKLRQLLESVTADSEQSGKSASV